MSRRRMVLLVAVVAFALLVTAQPPASAASTVTPTGGCALTRNALWESRLAGLAPHPRVVFGAADVTTLRKAAADPVLRTYHRGYLGWGKTALAQPLPVYRTGPKGTVGAASTGRIVSLGYALLATGDKVYSDRIRKEVAALVAFPEWTPSVYIGTAEVATAVAMGFSLTSGRMTRAERGAVHRALVERVLAPASCLWKSGDRMVAATDNWGVISNTGAALAALAVADRNRPLAAAALGRALPLANRALEQLSDGGTGEGPGYHNYLGGHAARLTATMDRSLGTVGLGAVRTVPAYSSWYRDVIGPSGLSANFGDAEPSRGSPLLSVWNGLRRGDALGAWQADQAIRTGRGTPLYLLWRRGSGTPPATGRAAAAYPRSGLATLRSGASGTATWLAMKGGTNAVSHSQLQLGSVVLEMLGQRFVSAYGMDNYSLPRYFTPLPRSQYFRNSTAAASTLSRRGENQTWTDTAALGRPVWHGDGSVSVSADLGRVLRVTSASRTVTLLPDGSVRLRDSVTSSATVPLRWRLHTEATVSVEGSGRRAVLTRGGRSVQVVLAAGTPGRLVTGRAPQTPGGRSNAGFTILQLDLDAVAGATVTTVEALVSAVAP